MSRKKHLQGLSGMPARRSSFALLFMLSVTSCVAIGFSLDVGAEATNDSAVCGSIKLGIPSFGTAGTAESAQSPARSVWQNDDVELQLVTPSEQANSINSGIDIRPKARTARSAGEAHHSRDSRTSHHRWPVQQFSTDRSDNYPSPRHGTNQGTYSQISNGRLIQESNNPTPQNQWAPQNNPAPQNNATPQNNPASQSSIEVGKTVSPSSPPVTTGTKRQEWSVPGTYERNQIASQTAEPVLNPQPRTVNSENSNPPTDLPIPVIDTPSNSNAASELVPKPVTAAPTSSSSSTQSSSSAQSSDLPLGTTLPGTQVVQPPIQQQPAGQFEGLAIPGLSPQNTPLAPQQASPVFQPPEGINHGQPLNFGQSANNGPEVPRQNYPRPSTQVMPPNVSSGNIYQGSPGSHSHIPQNGVPGGNSQLMPPHVGQPQVVQPPGTQPQFISPPSQQYPAQNGHTVGAMPGHSVLSPQSGAPVFGHSGYVPGTSGFRATVEYDAQQWMAPYSARAMNAAPTDMSPVIPTIAAIPAGFTPWWDAAVRKSVGTYSTAHPVDVGSLLKDALMYSPQVLAIKAEPEVQARVVIQEAAKFDWSAFLEATYDDLNDPVGNELQTGNGQDRLLTKKFRGAGGIRRKTLKGGEFRAAQEFGHENQNSRFFIPNNQGSTRLEMSYRQPLLDGSGRIYNESEIVLARIQANSSEDEVVDALQSHLIEVTEAYWTMYRARAEFFQRQKLLASAQDVLDRLEGRSQVDTIPRQVLRARAAVARAKTRIQRTLARVRDAEAQLRLLVNSPAMLNGGQTELMPMEAPSMITENAELQSVLQTALTNRPDISEAIRKMRASGIRLGVSRNELLPRLDFIVEAYVADLAGNSDVAQALRGQFFDNRPGYTVGLEFEIPVGNRAAIAKQEQRQWELKRSINIFRATVEKSLTDVEIANREVNTAYSEILSRFHSMQAAENESRYLKDRFEVLPASEDSATLLLEDLLDSFERLADEESAFVQALVDHAVALIKLKKEIGILLQSRNSRPDLEYSEQEWMQQRLDTAAEKQEGATATPISFGQPQASYGQAGPTTGSIQPTIPVQQQSMGQIPATGQAVLLPQGSLSRFSQHAIIGQGHSGAVPMPQTPTTWSRPRASLFGSK